MTRFKQVFGNVERITDMRFNSGQLPSRLRQLAFCKEYIDIGRMLTRQRFCDYFGGAIEVGVCVVEAALADVEPCSKDPASHKNEVFHSKRALPNLLDAICEPACIGVGPCRVG